jgi:hypothetical protein
MSVVTNKIIESEAIMGTLKKYILNVETGGQRYSINLEEAQKEGRHNVTSFSTVFV